jgi:tRNA pseudouridine38-40 synthase
VACPGVGAGLDSGPMSRTFLATLHFDGTGFVGWQRQPAGRSVQTEFERVLERLFDRSAVAHAAGRTDAGVHAVGQGAHADLADDLDPQWLVRRLARLLPPDVRVRAVTPVPDAFDARFAALRRHYRYRIATAAHGAEPLRARDTLSWPHPLDLAAVSAASELLLGEHDFAAFCKRREGATTVRQLQRFEWSRADDGVVAAELSADAFCHSMVRSLIGALLEVGRGRQGTDWPLALLRREVRANEVSVAPAHGLTLVAVDYPPDAELVSRIAITRRLRSPRVGDTRHKIDHSTS